MVAYATNWWLAALDLLLLMFHCAPLFCCGYKAAPGECEDGEREREAREERGDGARLSRWSALAGRVGRPRAQAPALGIAVAVAGSELN